VRAIVIGAGIGGLAAGIALTRAGWDVQVFEREQTPTEIGAGISLWPNALVALDRLGVWPDIRGAAAMPLGGARRPDGRWLSRMDAERPPPFEVLLVHRAQLRDELVRALPADVLVTGRPVHEVRPDGVVGHGAGTEQTDLVVAADGLRSATRAGLVPEHAGARYAGFTAWRGVTAEPFPSEAGSETWGRGCEFGATLMVDGRVYWFATANRPEGERAGDERAEVLRRFGHWHDPIARIVEATPAPAVLRHDIYSLATPLPPFGHGRVALLGDAAHAMTPNLGQGAGQALEDAVTLAALVRSGDVADALVRYDDLRRPRTERMVRAALRTARAIQSERPAAVAARDTLARLVPARLAARGARRMWAWTPPA
jgi:2-polyprenyl-6-methoxyphenol hydroxylase-like FAD-dependent oxidoreductase